MQFLQQEGKEEEGKAGDCDCERKFTQKKLENTKTQKPQTPQTELSTVKVLYRNFQRKYWQTDKKDIQ